MTTQDYETRVRVLEAQISLSNQKRLYTQSADHLAARNRHVMDLIRDPVNPLTADDLHKLADRFPERWGIYRTLLDAKP